MIPLVDATPLGCGHRWRGIGSYVRYLVRGLSERLPEASFLTIGGGADGVPSARAIALIEREPPRWSDLWPIYTLGLPRAVLKSGSGLYHFTSPETSTRPGNFKTIGTVYDLIPSEQMRPSADPRRLWRAAIYKWYTRNLKSADHLIAISRSTAATIIERLGVPASRISVIPLGIDAAEYRNRANHRRTLVRGQLRLPDRYWLTVTSPNPNKGWPDLIRALALARDSGLTIPLVIAGHWLPKQRRGLDALAGRLGVSDLTIFAGYVAEDVLPALYQEALAFIFPSHREGFGLPVLEAMTVGTPVIVSDEPAVLELVGDVAGVFPRREAGALVKLMATVAGDTVARSTMAARAADRSAHYSWRRMVEETIQVYDSV